MEAVVDLRGPVEAAIEAAREESDVVVRASWERWCVAQFAGSVRKVRRRAMARLWLRCGSGPWLTDELSLDAARELAAQLDHDGGVLSTEGAESVTVDRLGDNLPESDQDALAQGMATLGVGLDTPAARVWLHRQELIARSDGTSIAQSVVTSWDEIYRFGGSLVGSVDGKALSLPPPSTSDTGLSLEPVVIADPTAVLSLAAASAQGLRTSLSATPRLGRQSLAATTVSIERDPSVLGSLPAYDAEGVPCRYQPLIARGVAVGLLSDRSGACARGLTRSSGSLLDSGGHVAIAADALTVGASEGGPASVEELAKDVARGVLLRGPVQVVSTPDGPRVRGRASTIRDGAISNAVGPLELPDVATLLRGVEIATANRELTAVLEGGTRPLVGRCPGLLIRLSA